MSIEDNGLPLGVAERLDDLFLRLDGWRARPGIVLAAGVTILGLAVTMWWFGRPAPQVPIDELIPMAEPESAAVSQPVTSTAALSPPAGDSLAPVEDTAEPEIVVHVVGAVRLPGLVTVEAGSRVGDVVLAAGGAVDGADTQRLNLAAPVSDGMQVRVPLLDADPDEELIIVPPRPMGSGSVEAAEPPGPINLNDADVVQLESLPGVGPAIAAAIISWRDENGGFSRPEDLLQVPGIGPAKMGGLRDLVTTDG